VYANRSRVCGKATSSVVVRFYTHRNNTVD